MSDIVIMQILAIRNTARTNMFAADRVREIAEEFGYEELIDVLDTDRREYGEFILYGK